MQTKRHPTQLIHEKQTKFIEEVVPLLDGINGYITGIDVWLAEKGEAARKKLKHAAANSGVLTKFHNLVERYSMYLPEKLLDDANELFFLSLHLGKAPSEGQAELCIDRLFLFQDMIREIAGVKAVSHGARC